MKLTRLLTPTLALAMGLTALPASAHDHHWHGVKSFPCTSAHGDWAFDGLYGYTTKQAVTEFQKANGLPPDGFIDANLLAAVRARSGNA